MTQPSRTQLVAALVALAREARVACDCDCHRDPSALRCSLCRCLNRTIQPPLAAAIVTAFTVECECLSTGGDVSAYAFDLMCRKCMSHRGEHGDWCRCNGTGRVVANVDTWPIGAVYGVLHNVMSVDGWNMDAQRFDDGEWLVTVAGEWFDQATDPDTAAVNAVMRVLGATE